MTVHNGRKVVLIILNYSICNILMQLQGIYRKKMSKVLTLCFVKKSNAHADKKCCAFKCGHRFKGLLASPLLCYIPLWASSSGSSGIFHFPSFYFSCFSIHQASFYPPSNHHLTSSSHSCLFSWNLSETEYKLFDPFMIITLIFYKLL